MGGAACSSGANGGRAPTASAPRTRPAVQRPPGPSAAISGPMTGGNGTFLAEARPESGLGAAGFTEAEYTASGTATSYRSKGKLPTDGRFDLEADSTAPYSTRIVVRRPKRASRFNGTVVVEWLNVSAGFDAPAEYVYLRDEILRRGYAWVGVSAQLIGVEGGPTAVSVPGGAESGAGKGLRRLDPARYGKLRHPGDAFSYDIFTQVARALRQPGGVDALGGLTAERLLAVGESQSAFLLTTYVDGVQPLTRAFDGFLLHSRGGAPAPLGRPGGSVDIASSLSGAPTRIRTDLGVPVITVETETDVLGILGFLPARQPDGNRFRLWEVAGTAHADKYQLGDREATLGCPLPVNRGQQHAVLKAALRHLATWASGGAAPPKAPRLETREAGAAPTFVLDDVGNVRGGVRTPAVDAPVDILSGLAPPGSSVICLLLGSTRPIPDAVLARRYRSADAYLGQYRAALDRTIAAGFVLPDDRGALLREAAPSRVAG
ncbi:MAG: hypothetical protein HYX34_11830 [Actinobacteria bacterium]|nr:hypothetical protein [Actinomycetota bacterium]